MNQLQTVLDALDNGLPEARKEAIAIVKQMMQAEPVAWLELNESLDAWFLSYGHNPKAKTRPLYTHQAPQAVPAWLPASNPPTEEGEVLVIMQDGTCEVAWATYWNGNSNAFAGWTFRDPDMEDAQPTHWMPLPAAPKGAV